MFFESQPTVAGPSGYFFLVGFLRTAHIRWLADVYLVATSASLLLLLIPLMIFPSRLLLPHAAELGQGDHQASHWIILLPSGPAFDTHRYKVFATRKEPRRVDLKNLGHLPVQVVLKGTDDCVI